MMVSKCGSYTTIALATTIVNEPERSSGHMYRCLVEVEAAANRTAPLCFFYAVHLVLATGIGTQPTMPHYRTRC